MKITGIAIIALGLFVGYLGVNKVTESTKEIDFLGLKIDASNKKGQKTGTIYLVSSLFLVGGGAVVLKKK